QVRRQAQDLCNCRTRPFEIGDAPAIINRQIATHRPSELFKALLQSPSKCAPEGIVGVDEQHPDPTHPAALLRPRRQRPRRRRRATKEREEGAAVHGVRGHSMTSSAIDNKSCETISPSALAVLRLIISSNLVANCTGNSDGLAPRRMRST